MANFRVGVALRQNLPQSYVVRLTTFPDSHVGTAYVFLQGNQVGQRVDIPNIAGDPDKYSQCSFPDGFVLAQETSTVDPCADQAASLTSQIAAAKALNDQLQALQLKLLTAHTLAEQAKLRNAMTAIRQQLAAAEAAVTNAQRALQACRLSHLINHP